jgi:Kef-type K+ transport system membrane component KefB
MNSVLIIGMILLTGFLFGEIAVKLKLPKVTGYLMGGLLLNPQVTHVVEPGFMEGLEFIIDLSLAVITFAIGGHLTYKEFKTLGKSIFTIAVLQAELTLVAVALGLYAVFTFFPALVPFDPLYITPFVLLMGALALPTDPAVLLAIKNEYHAKGEVTSTIFGIAAIDDVLTFANWAVIVGIAKAALSVESAGIGKTFGLVALSLLLTVVIGVVCGIIFNLITKILPREDKNFLVISLFGMLLSCFGLAKMLGVDEMLSTMVMGFVVVNYNIYRSHIFQLLERYTEELIFVLFFTLSSMQIDLLSLDKAFYLVILFIVIRFAGKWAGAKSGALLSGASRNVRKHTIWGLVPQGGIIIGLALSLSEYKIFNPITELIISIVIGAVIIQELLSPMLIKRSLRRVGEID